MSSPTEKIGGVAAGHGHALVAVGGDGSGPGFIYTAGNASRGLPELLILGGFDPRVMGLALNELTEKMLADGAPLPEGFVDIEWTFPFKVRRASQIAKLKYTIQAGQILGHERYEVMQVMICDRDGRYPGDADCDPDFDVELV